MACIRPTTPVLLVGFCDGACALTRADANIKDAAITERTRMRALLGGCLRSFTVPRRQRRIPPRMRMLHLEFLAQHILSYWSKDEASGHERSCTLTPNAATDQRSADIQDIRNRAAVSRPFLHGL